MFELKSLCVFPGNLTARHREIFHKNPLFVGMRLPEVREVEPLEKKFPRISSIILDLMKVSSYLCKGGINFMTIC